MFIREDFENVIKDKFNVEKLSYIGTGKFSGNHNALLVFDAGKKILGIEVARNLYHFRMHEIEERIDRPGYFYSIAPRAHLFVTEKETCLNFNEITVSLPGKAFDCTSEVILLTIENS